MPFGQRLTTLLNGVTAALIVWIAVAEALLALVASQWGGGYVSQALVLIGLAIAGIFFVMGALQSKLQSLLGALVQREEQLIADSRTDPLTGLGNRAFALEEIASRSTSGEACALLLFELNQFRRVNEIEGPAAGDALLKEVGARLRQLLPHAALARWSGDEFVIIASLSREAELSSLCAKVGATVRTPYHIAGRTLHIAISLGAVVVSGEVPSPELFGRAAVAMQDAKAQGVPFRIFNTSIGRRIARESAILRALENAMAQGTGPGVHFQPIANAEECIVGLEALLRWEEPGLGTITPREILIAAEHANLSEDLALLVADKVCEVAHRYPNVTMAMNLTAAQVLVDNFPARLAHRVRSKEVHPSQVQLELTEETFVERQDELAWVLAAFRAEGFKIAVDNFGTSHASLTYLKGLQIDEIKFDRSVLLETRRMHAVALLAAQIELARSLGIGTTCEGVSDQEELEIALGAQCDRLQGFHLYRPMPVADLNRLLRGKGGIESGQSRRKGRAI